MTGPASNLSGEPSAFLTVPVTCPRSLLWPQPTTARATTVKAAMRRMTGPSCAANEELQAAEVHDAAVAAVAEIVEELRIDVIGDGMYRAIHKCCVHTSSVRG